ncbi:MAG: hypothetical protein QOF84_6834, partial [Streptomyces sp.]|nr:hypothetical protein [Streptomyces sp.]
MPRNDLRKRKVVAHTWHVLPASTSPAR